MAGTSNPTVTITFYYGGNQPPPAPSGFTVTYIDDYTVSLEWTTTGSANNTIIRVKDNGYPTSVTDGYLVYYGAANTANDTGVDYYNFFGKKYYVAFTDNRTSNDDPNWGWSIEYAAAELESPILSDLVTQVEEFNVLVGVLSGQVGYFFALFVVAIFLIFALWKRDMILYFVSGIISIVVGVLLVSQYSGLTIVIWFTGVYMLIQGLMRALGNDKPERGLSQFKEIINRVRGRHNE